MSGTVPLDSGWLAAHPLPVHGDGTTKNSRGRVLAIGGSKRVPGGLKLTAEAAFRVGAGKVVMATIASAAPSVGNDLPEAAVLALGEDDAGEIACIPPEPLMEALDYCDAVVLGPAMTEKGAASDVLGRVADALPQETALVADAAAVACAGGLEDRLQRLRGRLVLTPHAGEMASLCGCGEDAVADDPQGMARGAADRFGAVLVLKGTRTLIAVPGEPELLEYAGGGVGLATGGSGDVLAGAIAGLLARGAEPRVAAAWGVWLHGQAGSALAVRVGTVGFLGRELLPELPRWLPR